MSSEKDFMDFIKDAPAHPGHAGAKSRISQFLEKLCEENVTAGALCDLLHDWGYDRVRIKDCQTMIDVSKQGDDWREEIKGHEAADY